MKSIRELREERGWSPAELADRLGVSLASVYNWEAEKHEPRASQFKALAQLFDVPMESIRVPGEDSGDPGQTRIAGDASPLRRK